MPSFQGLEVAIVTQPDDNKLPEFPLSDASSQPALPSTGEVPPLDDSGSTCLSLDAQQAPKASPRISVYIPSNPGTQFGIEYVFHEESPPSRYFYFKIFMNGRNIANCGVNPLRNPAGCITRALCEPSARWKYKEDGVLLIRDGIEARCFSFLPSKNQSVAEDGGLIELQIFRAKGRRRRIPVIEGHRGQEAYGIGSPSGGLLDSPEEACFYDWILTDSKESPFVSFRFHYRSLSNLRQLNLAPDSTELDEFAARVSDISCVRPDDSSELSKEQSNISARPLPEIPTRKYVPNQDLESYTLVTTTSNLSVIQEEMEDDEGNIISGFPVRSDPIRGAKPMALELYECEEVIECQASFALQDSLVVNSEHLHVIHQRAISVAVEDATHTEEQDKVQNASDAVSIAAEADLSFKTGWRLSEMPRLLLVNDQTAKEVENAFRPNKHQRKGKRREIKTKPNIAKMAETGWLRFLGASRARPHELMSRRSEAALQDLLKDNPRSTEKHTSPEKRIMSQLISGHDTTQPSRGTASASNADSAMDEEDKLFINAAQQVWHSPSVEQIADSLRVALMTTAANEPLSAEYRPHVLLLCEAYGTRHSKIAKLEHQLKQEVDRHTSVEEHWMVQEARYKAEVKRLEMFIHRTSGTGMEAVALARAGSLIRSNRPSPTMGDRTTIEKSTVKEGTSNSTLDGSSKTTPQPEKPALALDEALPTRQGTVLSRTRTIDTSNEIRLSKGFRNMDNSKKKAINGTRRHKARDVDEEEALHKQEGEERRSRSTSVPPIGPSAFAIVDTARHDDSVDEKHDSARKPAAEESHEVEVGDVSQDQLNLASTTHMHEHKHEHKHEQEPDRTSDQNYTRHHRRQFSFVPGDDKTAVRLGGARAGVSGNAPASEDQTIQVPSVDTGRPAVRFSRENRRSRSAEWIRMPGPPRPDTDNSPGAANPTGAR
ncbi:hypothetical protein ACHAPA_006875 [Fusarium lateritium]